jgi:Protein of unknown function (DUF2726)
LFQKLFCCLIFFVHLLTFVAPAAAENGYQETVATWQEVYRKASEYSLPLQNLYAEVEAQVGPDKSRLNPAFAKKLSQQYPGSNYLNGIIGTLAINGYTFLTFDSTWKIIILRQKFGNLQKTYDFRNLTMVVTNGPNRVMFKLDMRRPERSQFTQVVIPAISVTAQHIWAQKRTKKGVPQPLKDILNDVYAYRISTGDGLRMDKLAEQVVEDEITRQNVLSMADEIYFNHLGLSAPSVRAIAHPSSVAQQDQPHPQAHRSFNLFDLLPWYFWPAIGCIGALKVLTTGKRRRSRPRQTRKLDSPVDFSMGGMKTPEDRKFTSRQTLHTPAEQAFQAALQQVLDSERYQLNGKTRLADLIQVDGAQWGPKWQGKFNKISRKHVDFVILEKNSSRILGVVELDDRSHLRDDRKERDQFVDEALEGAGIPILHYPCQRNYDFRELEDALEVVLGLTRTQWSAR